MFAICKYLIYMLCDHLSLSYLHSDFYRGYHLWGSVSDRAWWRQKAIAPKRV